MCPSGVTSLPVDCYFSELSLCKVNQACWCNSTQIFNCLFFRFTDSDYIFGIFKLIMFSLWYSWTIAHLAFNSIHLLHAGEGNMKTFIAYGFRKYEKSFTQEYHIPWGRCPQGIWYSKVNNFSYFLNPYAINVLLYRMKPRKHIHVKYCWQTYFKSIGTLS